MTPRILAARNDAARKRIAEATAKLAEKLGIQIIDLDAYQHRDPAIKALFQAEAIAQALEEIASNAGSNVPEPTVVAEAAPKQRGRPRKESNDDGTL